MAFSSLREASNFRSISSGVMRSASAYVGRLPVRVLLRRVVGILGRCDRLEYNPRLRIDLRNLVLLNEHLLGFGVLDFSEGVKSLNGLHQAFNLPVGHSGQEVLLVRVFLAASLGTA